MPVWISVEAEKNNVVGTITRPFAVVEVKQRGRATTRQVWYRSSGTSANGAGTVKHVYLRVFGFKPLNQIPSMFDLLHPDDKTMESMIARRLDPANACIAFNGFHLSKMPHHFDPDDEGLLNIEWVYAVVVAAADELGVGEEEWGEFFKPRYALLNRFPRLEDARTSATVFGGLLWDDFPVMASILRNHVWKAGSRSAPGEWNDGTLKRANRNAPVACRLTDAAVGVEGVVFTNQVDVYDWYCSVTGDAPLAWRTDFDAEWRKIICIFNASRCVQLAKRASACRIARGGEEAPALVADGWDKSCDQAVDLEGASFAAGCGAAEEKREEPEEAKTERVVTALPTANKDVVNASLVAEVAELRRWCAAHTTAPARSLCAAAAALKSTLRSVRTVEVLQSRSRATDELLGFATLQRPARNAGKRHNPARWNVRNICGSTSPVSEIVLHACRRVELLQASGAVSVDVHVPKTHAKGSLVRVLTDSGFTVDAGKGAAAMKLVKIVRA